MVGISEINLLFLYIIESSIQATRGIRVEKDEAAPLCSCFLQHPGRSGYGPHKMSENAEELK